MRGAADENSKTVDFVTFYTDIRVQCFLSASNREDISEDEVVQYVLSGRGDEIALPPGITKPDDVNLQYFENVFLKLLQGQYNDEYRVIIRLLPYHLSWHQLYVDALARFLKTNGDIKVEEINTESRVSYIRDKQQDMKNSTTEYAKVLLCVIKTIFDHSHLSEKLMNERMRYFFMVVMRTFIECVKLTPEFSSYFIDLDNKINGQSIREYLSSKTKNIYDNTTFLGRLKFLTNFLTAVFEAQQQFLAQDTVPELANSNLGRVIKLNEQLWLCANAYKDKLSWSMFRSDRLRKDYLPEILRVLVEHQQLLINHETKITYSNELLVLVQPFEEHGVPNEIQPIFADQLMKLFNTISNLSPLLSEYLNFDRSVLGYDPFKTYLRNKINKLVAQKDPETFFRQFRALLLMLKLIVEMEQIMQLQAQNVNINVIFCKFHSAFSLIVDKYKGGVHAGKGDKMRTVYLANLGGENPESKLAMGTVTLSLDEILATIEKFSSMQDNVMSTSQKAMLVLQFLEQNALCDAFRDQFISLDTSVNEKKWKQYLQETVGSYWNGYKHLDDVIAMIALVATYARNSDQAREENKATFNEMLEVICGNMDAYGEGLYFYYESRKEPVGLFAILGMDAKNSIRNTNELLSILLRIERRLATDNLVRLSQLAQFVCAILDNIMVNSFCEQQLRISLNKAHPDFETATFRGYLKLKANDTASVIKDPYRHLKDVVDFLRLLCDSTRCTPENVKNICDKMSKSGTMEKIYLRDYFVPILSNDGIASKNVDKKPSVVATMRLANMPSQSDVEREKPISGWACDLVQDESVYEL